MFFILLFIIRYNCLFKASTGKPVEFGLNFTKKSDKPGYTVKKFTETKIEEKSTSFGKLEFGLSFQKKDVSILT